MAESDLQDALKDCIESAKIGYKIASAKEKSLSKALSTAENRIQNALNDFDNSPYYAPETSEALKSQLLEIDKAFNRLSFAFQDDIRDLQEELYKFSITLFGRTMAGKSTLKEILTDGDGSSIGKGAQRTTVNVRTYNWKGLEITDVPGVGAFDGKDDEQIAFNAARKADMILFLITDDAPQAVDAEFFGKIVETGKPVILIMNVKKAVQDGKSLKFNTREINKQFEPERLEKIMTQFCSYAAQYGQTWEHIPVVYVHLRSAFLSQQENDPERKQTLYDASRIDCLKTMIINQVKEKGEYYRIKTFIDIISNPILTSMESMLEQSISNNAQVRTIIAKKRQLEDWKTVFYHDGRKQIQSLITSIRSELYSEIAAFAEEHFSDEKADKAWNDLLASKRINIRCQELLGYLELKCNDKLKEITQEITNELKFVASFSGDRSLRMHFIIDGQRVWDWSCLVAGGGLGIAGFLAVESTKFAALAGPLGWGAIGVFALGGLGSGLFKNNREKQEREARMRIEKNLRENVNKNCDLLQGEMEKSFDSMISGKIDGLLNEMNRIEKVVHSLANTQKNLAWKLDTHYLDLNKQLITEAIRLIGAAGLEYHVLEAARIPGNTLLILLNEGTVFPEEQYEKLCELMGERIEFVYDPEDKKTLISRIIGKETDSAEIRLNERNRVARMQLNNTDLYTSNRVRLAQQLAQVAIVNQ